MLVTAIQVLPHLGSTKVLIGYFPTPTAAARAYDRAALKYFGAKRCRGKLNFSVKDYGGGGEVGYSD